MTQLVFWVILIISRIKKAEQHNTTRVNMSLLTCKKKKKKIKTIELTNKLYFVVTESNRDVRNHRKMLK